MQSDLLKVKNIHRDKFPCNILIIPDGNGRWAKQRNKKVTYGHRVAAEKMKKIIEDLKTIENVKTLTLWGFSSDNWKRDKTEINGIMRILRVMINSFSGQLIKDQIRFIHIGRKDRIPKQLLESITILENKTKMFDRKVLALAIDFGGEDQIIRMLSKVRDLPKDLEIDKNILESIKDGGGVIPTSDLIIRTSGEIRISDIGWFNGKQTELYFSDKYFPDIDTDDILAAILDFSKRERRMGGRV
ncbi:polyprenyl diphosphate synthase [Patescibacteria group bacterium]|nr:polyprenyl diphosphate synthase [Patescibacteria group bacterium]